MMKALHYSIVPKDLVAHVFEVELRIAQPDATGQKLILPVWIPGSYMVREFARHIFAIEAFNSAGEVLAIEKVDKHTWQLAPTEGAVHVRYQVYAWGDSVRAASLEVERAFFNATCLCLAVVGQMHLSCQISFAKPDGEVFENWQLATALRRLPETALNAFGDYYAENYDELADHPVTMGIFQRETFDVCGVPHELVIAGKVLHLDKARLIQDLQTICQAQVKFFESEQSLAPMSRYVFMVHAVAQGYGGLEHRASTALICNKEDLPSIYQTEMTPGYMQFLGLCSHEYFHTWNVKRIKPIEFAEYDYERENYTTLLWLFEGVTSYYDDLFLVRTKCISQTEYLTLLSRTIASVMQGSGRHKQTLAESSFDAWIKYYRQDENAPNAIVSYYQKGALCALLLDLMIRVQTQHRYSLDDVMRMLWQRFGRDFYQKAQGVDEKQFLQCVFDVTGVNVADALHCFVHTTADLPLADYLEKVGVRFQEPQALQATLNAKIRFQQGMVVLASVSDEGAAYHAGLSAGDMLLAIDGVKITKQNFAKLCLRYQPGISATLHFFRREELKCTDLVFGEDRAPCFELMVVDQTRIVPWLLNSP